MPWGLIIVVAGLVLRFGIDGYNTLGDLLIGLGIAITVLIWVLLITVFAAVSTKTKRRF